MLVYAKPKVVLLDDDESLLEVIHFYLTKQFEDSAIIKTFSKSAPFLSYLQKSCYLPDSPSDIIHSFYDNNLDKSLIIKTLKDLSELSAIVVLDQELRGENVTGIDISATIREYFPSSYVSMLTSNVPSGTAIQLHNNQNIDLFVDKKDSDAVEKLYTYLSNHIESMNRHYDLDPIDVFPLSTHIESDAYITAKNAFLKKHSPLVFLTIHGNGDLALLEDNSEISFWRYNNREKNFIHYEH